MLRIATIMTTDVIALSPDLGVRDAMELLVKEHVSGAPVLDGDQVVGVVTLTDLAGLAAATPSAPLPPEERTPGVEDTPDDTDVDAEGVPGAFFYEYWDEDGAAPAQLQRAEDSHAWDTLAGTTVREVMTSDVLRLSPDVDVLEAAEFLRRHRIHRVLVMEGDELKGIVSTSDITRAVSEHRLSERRFVFGTPQVREDGSWW